jgi:hypothetical protein
MKLIHLYILVFIISSCASIKTKGANDNGSINAINEIESTMPKDTVHIGVSRTYKSLSAYFDSTSSKKNIHFLIDEGTYYSNGLWIDAENIVIEGKGQVNIYCKELYENVMWLLGNNIVVKNIHMKHFAPGKLEGQNCSGRVIGFDNAHNVTIENCDLNGCGIAGLHDNLFNSDIFIKNNYIHNNSVGAYTDIDGGVWDKEVDNHPVFRFENNRMENNGPSRVMESDSTIDYIISYSNANKEELQQYIAHEIMQWKNVESPFLATYNGNDFGDYHHIIFIDANGKSFDFGFGNNDFGEIELFFENDDLRDNPEYLEKTFKVYWEWKASSFPCCSGEYEMVEAYLPSIVKLEVAD